MLISAALFASLAQVAASAATAGPAIEVRSVAGPKAAPAPEAVTKRAGTTDGCNSAPAPGDSGEIIVCAIRPEGYRLNPDVLEAKRAMKNGGRPVRKGDVPSGNECQAVGPMGCRGVPTINMLAVAATAAQISERLAKGQEIGSVFETTPSPTEYQLYLEAKKEREEKEAQRTALAAQKAAAAAASAKSQGAKQDSESTAAHSSSP